MVLIDTDDISLVTIDDINGVTLTLSKAEINLPIDFESDDTWSERMASQYMIKKNG